MDRLDSSCLGNSYSSESTMFSQPTSSLSNCNGCLTKEPSSSFAGVDDAFVAASHVLEQNHKKNTDEIARPVYVTQPFLPPLEEFVPYLEKIWHNKILTNGGPFHRQLECALCDYLGVEHIALFTNGTLALVTALQALRVSGEVITTPYSFAATSHALLWNRLTPVFVDISRNGFNLDPEKIEAAITPKTTAILGVHCYGDPCQTAAIQEIADNYNLKVIYDAAHAFGVRDEGGSVLRHGDLSILSFHATKVFNTFEGGAIVCPDLKTKQRIDYLKNFGIANETTVVAPGINGKMSEIQAAFGLLNLNYIDQALERRKAIDAMYRDLLKNASGIRLMDLSTIVSNYSYFPILIEDDCQVNRDDLYKRLREKEIFARRYFYPLISDMPMYRGLPSADPDRLCFAKYASERIICLPIYPDLSDADVERIASAVTRPY